MIFDIYDLFSTNFALILGIPFLILGPMGEGMHSPIPPWIHPWTGHYYHNLQQAWEAISSGYSSNNFPSSILRVSFFFYFCFQLFLVGILDPCEYNSIGLDNYLDNFSFDVCVQ